MELKRAEMIAKDLIGYYAPGWAFGFDRAVCRLGCTKYRSKFITVSAHVVTVNDEASLINTVLHEIAHALTGRGAGHGADMPF